MKIKLSFIALLLTLMACTNKEQKDFEKVMESTDLALLETYLEVYKEASIEHIGAVNKRLANLTNDSIMYTAVKGQPVMELRYEAALEYVMNFPDGIHVDEVNEIIARDSAEVEKILLERAAEAEYENNYGDLKRRVENAWFYYDKYNVVFLSIPDKEGKGCGFAGSLHKLNIHPPLVFTYTVKPESNDLIAHVLNQSKDFFLTISVYSDCLYMQGAGKSIYYQRNPVSEEEYKKQHDDVVKSIRNFEKQKIEG